MPENPYCPSCISDNVTLGTDENNCEYIACHDCGFSAELEELYRETR